MKIWTLIMTVMTLNSFGQSPINGIVADQNGDFVPLANILLLENDSMISGTQTDFDGKFVFSNNIIANNLKIVGIIGSCQSDTVEVNSENFNRLKLTLFLYDSCTAKVNIPNCRLNYIMNGMYYVDLSDFDNDELKIVTGDQIMSKESYSPYSYQMIIEDKNYKDDNGKIYSGEELIRLEKLRMDKWEYSHFKPIVGGK